MIAFSGIDGAGKSTQIGLLKVHLVDNGFNVLVFWSRGGYSPGMMFLKKLMGLSKKISGNQESERKQNTKREKSFSNAKIRKLWLILSILDLIYYYGVYIRIKEIFGTIVICDRHIKDTEVDFRLNFPREKFYSWWLWKFLKFCLKKPKKYFIATIPVEESMRRSKLKNEPFPDSKEVLEKRLAIYDEFVQVTSYAVHINGMNSIEKIHAQILKELNLTSS